MPFRVVLDASVVLAACLDPRMDAKAELAAGAFKVLGEAGIRPAYIETLRDEVDRKVHDRVGHIVDALRALHMDPPPLPLEAGPTAMELMEPCFARLRRTAPEAVGGLQLLETRLAAILGEAAVTNRDHWDALLARVAAEALALLAEIQRRHDALNLEVLPRAGKANHERFRRIVPASDLEHIAVLAAMAEARGVDLIFVTLDGPLHGQRAEISREAPRLTVTTPTFLPRQISRHAGKA